MAEGLARQRDVAFSFTTFVEETRIAVRRSSGIGSIDQIAGKKIVTTSGTTSVQTLRKYVQKKGTPFDETFGKDHSDSFLILEGGRADAFVMDGQVLAGMIAHSKSPGDYQIVGDALAVEPIAIAFRKDDPSLKKVVNDTIAGLMKSGEIKTIYEKWFQRPIPPGNANLNLPPSQATLFAWSAPNDRSVEDLQKQ